MTKPHSFKSDKLTVSITDLDKLSHTVVNLCLKYGYRVTVNQHIVIYKGTIILKDFKTLSYNMKTVRFVMGHKCLEKNILKLKHGDKLELRQHSNNSKWRTKWTPIIEYNIVDPVILARDKECILNQNALNKIET